jgi:hypothetical protein
VELAEHDLSREGRVQVGRRPSSRTPRTNSMERTCRIGGSRLLRLAPRRSPEMDRWPRPVSVATAGRRRRRVARPEEVRRVEAGRDRPRRRRGWRPAGARDFRCPGSGTRAAGRRSIPI